MDWARELRWLLGAGCAGYIGIEAVPLGQSPALHGKAQALLPEARSTLADLPPGADLCGDQPHQASSFGGGRNDGGGRPSAGYMEQFTASIANYGVTHWNGSTANSNPNQAGDIHGDTAQSGEC